MWACYMLARVWVCSLSDWCRGCVRTCFLLARVHTTLFTNQREIDREREREKEREKERERERVREGEGERESNFYF